MEAGEIKVLMESLGQPLNRLELLHVMEELDGDGDGQINFEEFKVQAHNTHHTPTHNNSAQHTAHRVGSSSL